MINAKNQLKELLEGLGLPQDRAVYSSTQAEVAAEDALHKLAGYLATGLRSPEERSWWLQLHEADASLAQVFDRWFDEGVPELAMYGRALGEKNKATLVEALIWRRYGARVLGPGAMEALSELQEALSRG